MTESIEELRRQVNALRSEVASARTHLRFLERRHTPRRSRLALTLCTPPIVFAFAFFASPQVRHQPGKTQPGQQDPQLKQRMPFTVKGTFRVIDSKGKDIFVVRDAANGVYRGAYLKDSKGVIVASMIAAGKGGQIAAVNSRVPGSVAYLSTFDGSGEIGVRHKGMQTFLAKPSPDGGGAVLVYSVKGGVMPVAGLDTYDGGKGRVVVFQQKSGLPISFLAESDKQAGTGRVVVTLANGVGVFAAGAATNAGSACVDRAGALECLGIDVPMSIHIKPK